jgi:hypothetical protein
MKAAAAGLAGTLLWAASAPAAAARQVHAGLWPVMSTLQLCGVSLLGSGCVLPVWGQL